MNRTTVVLIASSTDLSCDFLVLALAKLNRPTVRINVDRHFSVSVVLRDESAYWTLAQDGRTVCSDEVAGVWYRADGTPVGEVENEEQHFVAEQWQELLRGLSSIPGPKWMNDPSLAMRAENKLLQLSTAQALGLQLPNTYMGCSADEASSFSSEENGDLIIKAVSRPYLESSQRFIFTNKLLPEADLTGIEVCPAILQNAIMPKSDIRANVVGDRVLAASLSSGMLDWRLDESDTKWCPVTLPESIVEGLVALCNHLGLSFGACDLALADGQYYFLEVNPFGEWSWLERSASLPISDSIARALCE